MTHTTHTLDGRRILITWVSPRPRASSGRTGGRSRSKGTDVIRFRDRRIREYWTLSKEVDVFGRWGQSLAP
jgi:hypothetical protein